MTNKALIIIIITFVSNSQRTLTFMDGNYMLMHRLTHTMATDYIKTNAVRILNLDLNLNIDYSREMKIFKNKKTSSALIKNLFANTSKIINDIRYNEKQIKTKIEDFFKFYETDTQYLELQIKKNTELNVFVGVELEKTLYRKKIQVKSHKSHDLNRILSILTLFRESYSSFGEIEEVMIRFNYIFLLFKNLSKRLKVQPLYKCKFNHNTLNLEGLMETIESIQFMFCEFFESTKLKNTEGLYKKLYEYEQTKEISAYNVQANWFTSSKDFDLKIKTMFVLCNFYKQMFDNTLEKCTKTCENFEKSLKHLIIVKKKFTYEINKIKLNNTKELSENIVFYNMLVDMNDILWIFLLKFHFLNKVTLEFTFERLYDCDAKRKYYSSQIDSENNCMIEILTIQNCKNFNPKSYEKYYESDLNEIKLKILIDSLQTKEKNKENLCELMEKKHDNIFKNLQFKTYSCYIKLLNFLEKTSRYTVSASLYNNSKFTSDFEVCKKKLKKNINILERSFENNKDLPNDDGIQKIANYANNFLSCLAQFKSQNNSYNFGILNSEIKNLNTYVYKRGVNLLNVDFNAKKFLKYKIDSKFEDFFSALRLYDKICSFYQEFVDINSKIFLQLEKNNFELIGQSLDDLIKVLTVFDAIDIKIDTLQNSFPFVNFCDFYNRSQIENQVHELINELQRKIDFSYKGVFEKCRCIYQGTIILNKENLAKVINEIYSESVITKTFYIFLTRFDKSMYQTQKDKNFQEYINSPYCYINIEVLINLDSNSDNKNKNTGEKSYLYDLDDRVDTLVSILRYLLVFNPNIFIFRFETLISKYLENASKNENDYYHIFLRLIAFNRNRKQLYDSKKDTDGIINRYNINYDSIRYDELKPMVERFLELSNITILLSDLQDKKLRDQYISTHNFLLNMEEGLPLLFRTSCCKISNRNISISGIYTVIKVNLEHIAGMICNDSTPYNIESLKTLIDKMELTSSKINILYDLKHSIQGIEKNKTNEKSDDYKYNILFGIYHKYNMHANLGLYFSKCIFEKLPLKASEWNLTINTLLHKYFLDFDSTSKNFIRAFKFKPSKHSKYIDEIKDIVTKNIYKGFTKLLKIELNQFVSTSKNSDDDLPFCLEKIILVYHTLAQYIIPCEKDDCKLFINNFIQQKINGKIFKSEDTIHKEIEEFKRFSKVSVDIFTCKLNTIIESLAEFNSEDNVFMVLSILLNMKSSKFECISNLIDKLYNAIPKQISNVCHFESNQSYNKCLSYIIELEYISKSVNHQNDRDLVFEIQISWLMHLHKQYNQSNKHIKCNWNPRNDQSIDMYIQEGKEALNKICLMYHSDQPYYERHLLLSQVPHIIFYGHCLFTLKCLEYLYSINLKDSKIKGSFFAKKMRQEVEIFLYKAKIGFFDGLFKATLIHFKQAACFIESIKDLQIILDKQTKPIKFIMHYIRNSILELIRILTKNTDTYTISLIDARIKTLKQLQSFFYNGISTQDELYSEKRSIKTFYSLKLNEWYIEVRDTFDHNLSRLIKNSYRNKIYISIKKLSVKSKYSDPARRLYDYNDFLGSKLSKEIFLDRCENTQYFENLVDLVNNAIDYQNITLQEIFSKNRNFSQIKDSFLNSNNQLLESLKKFTISTSKIACEKINNTMLVDTVYYTIENALNKQLIFLITDDIAKSNCQDELIQLEENAFTILNNFEISINNWKVQIQIPKLNKILVFLDSNIKVKIILSIETSMENIRCEKINKTDIEVSTNGPEMFEQNTMYITGEKLKVLNKIKEKTLLIDLSKIEDSKDTKSNVRKKKK